jgi:hypothetical protein
VATFVEKVEIVFLCMHDELVIADNEGNNKCTYTNSDSFFLPNPAPHGNSTKWQCAVGANGIFFVRKVSCVSVTVLVNSKSPS